MAETVKWGASPNQQSTNPHALMRRTWGSGTSFPTKWPVDAFFLREDEGILYQNTGTEDTPTWGTGILITDTTFAGQVLALG